MAEKEIGVLAEDFHSRVIVEVIMRSRCQPIPSVLPLSLCRLQPITQGHQFIHLGDNALLFGERWEWDRQFFDLLAADARKSDASSHRDDGCSLPPDEETYILICKEWPNRGNAATDTCTESRNIRAACGGPSDANQEITFLTQIRGGGRVLIYERSSERSFGKFNRAIDERDACPRLVVAFTWRTLPHKNLSNRAEPYPPPARWNVEPSLVRPDFGKARLFFQLPFSDAPLFLRVNAIEEC